MRRPFARFRGRAGRLTGSWWRRFGVRSSPRPRAPMRGTKRAGGGPNGELHAAGVPWHPLGTFLAPARHHATIGRRKQDDAQRDGADKPSSDGDGPQRDYERERSDRDAHIGYSLLPPSSPEMAFSAYLRLPRSIAQRARLAYLLGFRRMHLRKPFRVPSAAAPAVVLKSERWVPPGQQLHRHLGRRLQQSRWPCASS